MFDPVCPCLKHWTPENAMNIAWHKYNVVRRLQMENICLPALFLWFMFCFLFFPGGPCVTLQHYQLCVTPVRRVSRIVHLKEVSSKGSKSPQESSCVLDNFFFVCVGFPFALRDVSRTFFKICNFCQTKSSGMTCKRPCYTAPIGFLTRNLLIYCIKTDTLLVNKGHQTWLFRVLSTDCLFSSL